MARILKALQNLEQQGSLRPSAAPSQPADEASLVEALDAGSQSADDKQASAAVEAEAGTKTIVAAAPAPSAFTAEEIAKAEERQQLLDHLAEQLQSTIDQRDQVANEVEQVRQQLERRDQQYQEEAERLKQLLQENEGKTKQLEASLHAQLEKELVAVNQKRQESAEQLESVRTELEASNQRYHTDIEQLRTLLATQAEAARQNETQLHSELHKQQQAFEAQLSAMESRFRNEVESLARRAEPPIAEPAAKKASPPDSQPRAKGTPFLLAADSPEREKPSPVPLKNRGPLREAISDLNSPDLAGPLRDIVAAIAAPEIRPRSIFLGCCTNDVSTSWLATRLAAVLHQPKLPVLLIDAALDSKSLSADFGLDNEAGFFEVVRKESSPNARILVDPETGLGLLPAGKSAYVLSESVQDQQALQWFFEEIKSDWPLLLFSGESPYCPTTTLLARSADQVFLQVEVGVDNQPQVAATLQGYQDLGIELTGLLATGRSV